MKKRILLISILVITMIVFIGCNDESNDGDLNQEGTEDSNQEVNDGSNNEEKDEDIDKEESDEKDSSETMPEGAE